MKGRSTALLCGALLALQFIVWCTPATPEAKAWNLKVICCELPIPLQCCDKDDDGYWGPDGLTGPPTKSVGDGESNSYQDGSRMAEQQCGSDPQPDGDPDTYDYDPGPQPPNYPLQR